MFSSMRSEFHSPLANVLVFKRASCSYRTRCALPKERIGWTYITIILRFGFRAFQLEDSSQQDRLFGAILRTRRIDSFMKDFVIGKSLHQWAREFARTCCNKAIGYLVMEKKPTKRVSCYVGVLKPSC